MLNKIISYLERRRINKWKKLTAQIYPDLSSRSAALLAEGMETAETEAFGRGETIDSAFISHHPEGGYLIDYYTPEAAEIEE